MRHTVEQYLHEQLENLGLWDNEADEVIALAKTDATMSPIKDRWNDPSDGYQLGVYVSLMVNLKRIAKEHLQKTAPHHFALANLP